MKKWHNTPLTSEYVRRIIHGNSTIYYDFRDEVEKSLARMDLQLLEELYKKENVSQRL